MVNSNIIAQKDKYSPMMRKYLEASQLYGDAILFYQLGDFYEMFFDDAIIASKVLDLTLTGKECGKGNDRAPMCGIPIHAIDNYLPKLVQAGYKVAVCNQMGDPSLTKPSEIMEREVVKIVTAGTLTENLDEKTNNYIMSIAKKGNGLGVSYADITTGKLNAIKCDSIKTLEDTLSRVKPSEIIVNSEAKQLEDKIQLVKLGIVPKFSQYEDYAFGYSQALKTCKVQFGVANLSVFDLTDDDKEIVMSVGGLIEYLNETQKRLLSNINKIYKEKSELYLYLDSNTRRNLELTENMTTRKKKGSLIGLFDRTKTSMGARLLRSYIEEPVRDENIINDRLDAVEELLNKQMLVDEVSATLSSIYDIERVTGKIAYGNIMPKDCVSLKGSLIKANELKKQLSNSVTCSLLKLQLSNLGNFDDIIDILERSIKDDPPTTLKEGGYIKAGFDRTLDDYNNAGLMGQQWLIELEAKIKQETGIKNVRVSYNRVFGYYIEVSKGQVDLVPKNWIRRQTTTNGERFINEELKVMEDKILNCTQNAIVLEANLYAEIKSFLQSKVPLLQQLSKAIAVIDTLIAFAIVAKEGNYCRPIINNSINKIEIVSGRHPVIEQLLNGNDFVPNDCYLDSEEDRTMIITGPNMAGKSTYMRQVAIITLLAHIGSFVPAKSASIAITDRIFTRIGASDDLAFGQSTFMVEMTEVAGILNNATKQSLLLLDEVGRGTSTYDGLSIAWSVVEYLSKHLTCKTLFATHYHELTDLEGKIEGVKNYRVLVKEVNNNIIFLHKIARGSANKSFGIEVAKLAGLPEEIIARAKEILYFQETANSSATKNSFNEKTLTSSKTKENINVTEVLNILSDIDMNTVSPLVAFSTLQNLVDKVKK